MNTRHCDSPPFVSLVLVGAHTAIQIFAPVTILLVICQSRQLSAVRPSHPPQRITIQPSGSVISAQDNQAVFLSMVAFLVGQVVHQVSAAQLLAASQA